MSKVVEQIRVDYSIDKVIDAIRMISMRTASPLTEGDNVFTIKLKVKKSLLSSPTPASVMLQLKESAKVENATVIKLTAANIGIGPLQVRECEKKIESMKEMLFHDLKELEKENAAIAMAAGKKNYKSRKLKRKHFKIGVA